MLPQSYSRMKPHNPDSNGSGIQKKHEHLIFQLCLPIFLLNLLFIKFLFRRHLHILIHWNRISIYENYYRVCSKGTNYLLLNIQKYCLYNTNEGRWPYTEHLAVASAYQYKIRPPMHYKWRQQNCMVKNGYCMIINNFTLTVFGMKKTF